VAQLPQEDQLRLLGGLSKTEGELLRSSSSLKAVKKAGQASAAAPSSSSPRADTNATGIPASDDDMSSAGQSMGAASHSLQSIGSTSTVTVGSMASQMTDYSKFVPTNIYNKSQGLVKKGLASAALKKVGRAMADMGVKAKARGVDLEMCGYAELRARLHTDLGLELSATEVDQLMRKFDRDHQGQVEINTLLGSAALLHDQRKRRQHVAKTMEEQRKRGRVVDERIRAEDRAANALGEAAYDAIVRGDVSVEYPKNIRAGALMSRKDFRKLLKTLGLDLDKEARRELEERYHEPSNPK
jgi:Ca2+-binding EF-hand superfamily protein